MRDWCPRPKGPGFGQSRFPARSGDTARKGGLGSGLHPWAKSGRVDRSEITRQRFILYTRSSYVADMVGDYFQQEGIVLPTSIELGNMEAIKELVKLELGISILAPWVARRELKEGASVSSRWARASWSGPGVFSCAKAST